jgi:hypothetical protein
MRGVMMGLRFTISSFWIFSNCSLVITAIYTNTGLKNLVNASRSVNQRDQQLCQEHNVYDRKTQTRSIKVETQYTT